MASRGVLDYDTIEMENVGDKDNFHSLAMDPFLRSSSIGSNYPLFLVGSRSPSVASQSNKIFTSISRSQSLCSYNPNSSTGHGSMGQGSQVLTTPGTLREARTGRRKKVSDHNKKKKKKCNKTKRRKTVKEVEEQQIMSSAGSERRRLALVISIFAAGIFIIAVLLIAISLRMAPAIDAKVRKENEQLMQSFGDENVYNATPSTATTLDPAGATNTST